MEASWQAYYDPDGRFHNRDDTVTPGIMALENLGLTMESYINDPLTDTHAILARGGGRIVLSFMGTLSSRNMLTDLKFSQVPLPNLCLSKTQIKVGDYFALFGE